ncbi:hypothetical protein [Kutzneria chonburiensis]|uniref:Uncharacterized protein n=1 Tax=Kutzneria chonburiensis TaxID=1483604 RepID=A0ABV6NA26_9PSEU|nr:hypothetical protein [Kutzneria chonburiensis]
MGTTCVCGHAAAAHEHYRPGSDCALCDCPRFRDPEQPTSWWARLRKLLSR